MQPVTRGTVFGGYRREAVMVIAMDDPDDVGEDDAMCEVEFYGPLSETPVGTRMVVHLSAIEYLSGRGLPNS
jgi:hypothetical protein